MKNETQKLTIKRILERENLTISALAEKVEISRNYLSQLINHEKQLSDKDWKKITESYPEHLISGEIILKPKRITKSESEELFKKPAKEIKIKKEESIEQITVDQTKPEEKISQSEIKTKPEERHKNLNCPHCSFHMKVQYQHLAIARPLCPIHNEPMLTKEEFAKFNPINNSGNKKLIADFLKNINPIKYLF
jgi:transcriptional regulator with XRE-family HTH domain